MNIILTTRCNRKCPFCFTGIVKHSDMTMENINYIFDFLHNNNINEFRMLGGEPTLHHNFIEIVEQARERGFRLFLMTNGITDSDIVDYLNTINIRILCNVSPQYKDIDDNVQKREYFLSTLSNKVAQAVTMTQPFVDIHRLLTNIEKYKLVKHIRVGIAHPICKARLQNKYLHPLNYKAAGRVLTDIFNKCEKQNINLSTDCGILPCMFDDIANVNTNVCSCSPVLDVDTNLDVFYCYPTQRDYHVNLREYKTIRQLYDHFVQKYATIKKQNFSSECELCTINTTCYKGCISHKLM